MAYRLTGYTHIPEFAIVTISGADSDDICDTCEDPDNCDTCDAMETHDAAYFNAQCLKRPQLVMLSPDESKHLISCFHQKQTPLIKARPLLDKHQISPDRIMAVTIDEDAQYGVAATVRYHVFSSAAPTKAAPLTFIDGLILYISLRQTSARVPILVANQLISESFTLRRQLRDTAVTDFGHYHIKDF